MTPWQRIVLHHTAGTDHVTLDAESIRRYHVEGRGWSDVGYHWIVEEVDGVYVAVMGRPLYRTGAHVYRHNTGSVGVALVGDWTSAPPPVEQVWRTAELCAGLCRTLSIRTAEICGHRDLRPTTCPGRVPVDEIRRLVAELRTGRYPRADDYERRDR